MYSLQRVRACVVQSSYHTSRLPPHMPLRIDQRYLESPCLHPLLMTNFSNHHRFMNHFYPATTNTECLNWSLPSQYGYYTLLFRDSDQWPYLEAVPCKPLKVCLSVNRHPSNYQCTDSSTVVVFPADISMYQSVGCAEFQPRLICYSIAIRLL